MLAHNRIDALLREIHEGYGKLLADKTVVFIRDSRLCYQFRNIAALLISKQLIKCQDYIVYDDSEDNQNIVIDPECNPIDNKYNNNWPKIIGFCGISKSLVC